MKRHHANRHHALLGLLSLAALGMGTSHGDAFGCRDRAYLKYSTVITCRPYNAFSPICSGNIECNGCCPFPMGFNPMCCTPSMFSPMCNGMGSCPPPPCYPGCGSTNVAVFSGGPPMMMPPASPYQAPMPGMPHGGYYQGPYGVSPTGHHPSYYPPYYPTNHPPAGWPGNYGR